MIKILFALLFFALVVSVTSSFRARVTTRTDNIFSTAAVVDNAVVKGLRFTIRRRETLSNGTSVSGSHGSVTFVPLINPFSIFANWNRAFTFNNGSSSNNGLEFEFSGSTGVGGIAYNRIQEFNGTHVLRSFRIGSFSFSVTNQSVSGQVKYIEVTGRGTLLVPNGGLRVIFTFIVPEDEVEITVGNLQNTIPPQSLEAIIEIDASSYQYAASNSYLRLVGLVATGSVSRSVNGSASSKALIESETITVGFNRQVSATVNGQVSNTDANVQLESTTSRDGITQFFLAQLRRTLGARLTANRFTVDCPAQATNCVIDPTTSAPNSASSVCISLALILICALATLF